MRVTNTTRTPRTIPLFFISFICCRQATGGPQQFVGADANTKHTDNHTLAPINRVSQLITHTHKNKQTKQSSKTIGFSSPVEEILAPLV